MKQLLKKKKTVKVLPSFINELELRISEIPFHFVMIVQ